MTVLRFILNLLITTALLFLFNAFDWITLSSNGDRVGFDDTTWTSFGSVLLIAFVMWLVTHVVGFLYGISVLLTAGLMLLAYPFFGWAVLQGVEHFMPGTLTLHGFWITVLCGWLLMFVRLSSSKN